MMARGMNRASAAMCTTRLTLSTVCARMLRRYLLCGVFGLARSNKPTSLVEISRPKGERDERGASAVQFEIFSRHNVTAFRAKVARIGNFEYGWAILNPTRE